MKILLKLWKIYYMCKMYNIFNGKLHICQEILSKFWPWKYLIERILNLTKKICIFETLNQEIYSLGRNLVRIWEFGGHPANLEFLPINQNESSFYHLSMIKSGMNYIKSIISILSDFCQKSEKTFFLQNFAIYKKGPMNNPPTLMVFIITTNYQN